MDEAGNLRAELDELREAVLEDWIVITTRNVDAIRAMQGSIRAMESTLSWRVTRPLRLFRSVQLRASQIGYVRASQLAAARLAEKLGRDR
jgi:hypothetical protein